MLEIYLQYSEKFFIWSTTINNNSHCWSYTQTTRKKWKRMTAVPGLIKTKNLISCDSPYIERNVRLYNWVENLIVRKITKSSKLLIRLRFYCVKCDFIKWRVESNYGAGTLQFKKRIICTYFACLFKCLYLINVKRLDRILCGTSRDPRKGLWISKFQKFSSKKLRFP